MEISLVFQHHPDDDIWEEYAFGRLDPRQEQAVEEHLLICQRCQTAAANADVYLRSMKVAVARLAVQRPKQRWKLLTFQPAKRPAPIALAGVIAAVAAVLWMVPLRPVQAGKAAAAPVVLESLRAGSAAAMNRAPAKRALDLSIRLADVPTSAHYRLVVVNRTGQTIWSGVPSEDQRVLSAHIAEAPRAGTYWVRLFGDSPALLAEYGLKLE